jgi:hypothetical protein
MSELPVVAHSSRKANAPASDPALETPSATKYPRIASRWRPAAARADLVSATVYLLPDKLALIKQNCAETNRRISDFISEAVDDYLRKPR